MAEIKKARIFLRRGTDASRLGTDLCEGELGYSTNGKRVFVGDGSTLGGNSLGTTVFLLPATSATLPTADPFTTVTTLTAVTADGRAEIGDMAFVPASTYNVSSFNGYVSGYPAENVTSTPHSTFGTLYVLSARDGGTGALTWTVANSGIPVSHLDIPDNSIAGDKIHGGRISGDLTFSDDITALSSLTLSGVAASASEVQNLTGSIIYPLGITSSAEVTAVSSIYQLGVTTGSNTVPCSGANKELEAQWSGSTLTFTTNTTNTGITNAGTGSTGSMNSYAGFGGQTQLGVNYAKIRVDIADVRALTNRSDLQWSNIDDFIFAFTSANMETKSGFLGYRDHGMGMNVIVNWDLRSNDKGSMDTRTHANMHYIPNSYTSANQYLEMHLGGDYPCSLKLIAIKLR